MTTNDNWLEEAEIIRKCTPKEIEERFEFLKKSNVPLWLPSNSYDWSVAQILSFELLGHVRTYFKYDWYKEGRVVIKDILPGLRERNLGDDILVGNLEHLPVAEYQQRLLSGQDELWVTVYNLRDTEPPYILDGNRHAIALYENVREGWTNLIDTPFTFFVVAPLSI